MVGGRRGRSNVVAKWNASCTASRKSRAVVYSDGGTELCGDMHDDALLVLSCYLLPATAWYGALRQISSINS